MNIYVFTYGTLRPGGALDGAMSGRHIARASLPDATLFRHPRARFPVLELDSPGSDVIGDVFSVNVMDLAFVTGMELGAGYDVAWRTVTLDDDSFTEVDAIVFGWPDYLPVGPVIRSGDWLSVEAHEACADLDNNAGFVTRRKATR